MGYPTPTPRPPHTPPDTLPPGYPTPFWIPPGYHTTPAHATRNALPPWKEHGSRDTLPLKGHGTRDLYGA